MPMGSDPELTPHAPPPQQSQSSSDSDIPNDCLPLLHASVVVHVDGIITRTTLLQRFSNPSEESIHEARYMFPLYDGAVVVAFRCTVGQERELFGKVQAKEEARSTFKKAVKRHETAALLEEHTPEIFETVIGNIPAQTDIEVRIEYLGEAKTSVLDQTGDVIDIIIPMSIAPRYGESSSFPGNSSTRVNREGLSIEVKVTDKVKVTDSGTVKKLHCNHEVETEKNVPFNPTKASSLAELSKSAVKASSSVVPPPTQSVIRYASDVAIMDEDFVVSVENNPSHPLRSRAVLSPSDENGLAAVMINIKPAEIFKSAARADQFAGEIIFVLDRSGSMELFDYVDQRRGAERTKLATLKRAMPLALSSLPETCHFNVVSFGSDAEFLWRGSMPYTNKNLDFAQRYLQRLEANMGGTELLHALKKAVDSRRAEQSSTQIILVTDGEVQSDSILEFVWNTRQELGDKIRFFALGIGFQVPHRLINRIGEFGGGYGEVVDIEAKPQWEDRLIAMLAAGIGPKSWNCTIDLGPGFERQSLMSDRFWDESTRQESESLGIVPYVQAPYPIPPMHPFAFRSVFLLLDIRSGKPPTKVILSVSTDEAKPGTEHVLFLEPAKTDMSTIQHLAAKAALLSLEAEVDRQTPSRRQEELAKKNAVALGTNFAVISRWTSYVAVKDSTGIVEEVDFDRDCSQASLRALRYRAGNGTKSGEI
ncbi:von Willebrand domain-containing protein [Colletotrichum tabaci]|uniref:von Willebrand domain-containing protein n=1 Tax=Colletotrichum tabaci TaxID=1209068 RepID=A0AAV9TJ24_9PEZI